MLSIALIAMLSASPPTSGILPPDAGTPTSALSDTKIEETLPTNTKTEAQPTTPTDPASPSNHEQQASEAREDRPAQSTAGVFIQNRFNPDISLITDFALAGANVSDETAESLSVPGFLVESEREGKGCSPGDC